MTSVPLAFEGRSISVEGFATNIDNECGDLNSSSRLQKADAIRKASNPPETSKDLAVLRTENVLHPLEENYLGDMT